MSTCHWTVGPLDGPLISHRRKLIRPYDMEASIEMFRAQKYYINTGYGSLLRRWNRQRKNNSFLRCL